MKHIKLLLLSLLALPLQTEALIESKFVNNVSLESGWFDVNKTFSTVTGYEDSDLCWAAAASNVIKWWQLQQPSVPPGTPMGAATATYSSNIFEIFVNSFVNDGGDEYDGFNWWVSGTIPDEPLKPGADPAGYWSSIFPDASILFNQENFEPDSSFTAGDITPWIDFCDTMVRNVDLGHAMSFGIYNDDFGGAHAVTMWGFTIDTDTNNITSIYMTDSDDVDQSDGLPHVEETLLTIGIDYDSDDGKIYLSDSYHGGGGWYIGDVTFYAVTALIPEPSSGVLCLAGFLIVVVRRRK